MLDNLVIVFAIVSAYLIGSLPFSFIIPKLFKGIDIRTVGSKNVGATNVLRTCGFFYGFLAFALDSLKGGMVYIISFKFLDINFAILLGFITVLGHCYSIFLRFRGGKGVATFSGFVFFLSPFSFLSLLIVFIIVVVITRYVSLGSIIIAALIGPTYFIFSNSLMVSFGLAITGFFIILKHLGNINRLLSGKENKISFRRDKK